MRTSSILFLLLAVVFPSALPAQHDLVYIKSNRLVGTMPNYLYTVGCEDSVRIHEVFVETVDHYLSPDLPREKLEVTVICSGVYRIGPTEESRVGVVTDYLGELDTVFFRAQPIVPVIRFGANNWRKDSMKVNVAKAQSGLRAVVEGYDIDAVCQMNGFTLTRASEYGLKTVRNVGGSFSAASRRLMARLESGNILLFRQITYRCPGQSRPVRAPDLVITVY